MIRTPSARKCHFVRLDKPRPEDNGATLTPDRVFAAIEPTPPTAFDERNITHIVKIDYHPDMTLTTRIRTEDDRKLFVRGIQDIELKHIEMWLLCEEVLTP